MAVATILITATRSGAPSITVLATRANSPRTIIINRGPQGIQGDQGEQGEQGEQGDPGPTGPEGPGVSMGLACGLAIALG